MTACICKVKEVTLVCAAAVCLNEGLSASSFRGKLCFQEEDNLIDLGRKHGTLLDMKDFEDNS